MSKEKPGILAQLALKHGSDKWGHHWYCNHYERHLLKFKENPITILELGIGGYEYPDRGGAGLYMWQEFFSKARIVGLDLYDKSGIQKKDRIFIFQGSQVDEEKLSYIINETGVPAVIIDDASHMNMLTVISFMLLFPKLAPGGIYIIEDIESSWWEEHGFDGCRDNDNLEVPTTINFYRRLLNEVNAKTTGSSLYPIESMHFYENMVIIHKK